MKLNFTTVLLFALIVSLVFSYTSFTKFSDVNNSLMAELAKQQQYSLQLEALNAQQVRLEFDRANDIINPENVNEQDETAHLALLEEAEQPNELVTKELEDDVPSAFIASILDEQSKFEDGGIVVNITSEQQLLFQSLNAQLDDPFSVSTVDLKQFISAEALALLPKPMQLLILNKVSDLIHAGDITLE